MRRLILLAIALLLVACEDDPLPIIERPTPEEAAPTGVDAGARTAMHRLTGTEWRAAAEALTGVTYSGDLPDDFVLHGFSSVGAAEVTIAPLELELLEAAAWDVADAILPEGADPASVLGCSVEAPLGAEDVLDPEPCARAFAVRYLTKAFRRPATRRDVDQWTSLFTAVHTQTGSAHLATRAMVAATLLAPDFLFRLEFGLPLDGETELRLLDGHEQAARISFSLLDGPPSDALATLGASGGLSSPADITAAAAEAMSDAQADAVWARFFTEWADLDRIELVTKDAEVFPEWTPTLRAAMTAEAELLWRSVALEEDADLRTLFTTTEGRIDGELAAIYGVEAPPEPFAPVDLPAERAGLLSRGAFLASRSHATETSPTLRGKYVRTRLLCGDISPPPEGVVTELPEGVEGSLRDRLAIHSEAPQCSYCHDLMDPIGFAFEHFDAVGRWREDDNGYAIDDASHLDGEPFAGAAGLGAALAAHADLPRCVAVNAFAHVLGHIEQIEERGQVDGVTTAFAGGGHRLSSLTAAVADTLAFRTVGVPDGGACSEAEEDTVRPCSTECGDGEEVCRGGTWLGCTAARPTQEVCNGLDDDCDGDIDGDVIVACEAGAVPGVAYCQDGELTPCQGVPAAESCNGLDDDGDGDVDEMAVELWTMAAGELTSFHGDCHPSANPHSDHCRSAVKRACNDRGCAPAGIGPVAADVTESDFAVACLSDAQVLSTAYSTLVNHHDGCNGSTRFGPACNAAINRWCASQGLTTGYGPVEHNGDLAIVACTPTATVIQTTYTALSAFEATCTAGGERMGPACDRAFHAYCQSEGYQTGHGPLENSGDVAVAACIGSLP